MRSWIRATDRSPKHCQHVLARHENGEICIESYYECVPKGFSFDSLYGPATHWMPVPDQPDEGTPEWEKVDRWRVRCPKCGEVRNDTEPRKYCPECGVRLEVAE